MPMKRFSFKLVAITLFFCILASSCTQQADSIVPHEDSDEMAQARSLLAKSGNIVGFPQPDNYDRTAVRSSGDDYQNLSPIWDRAITHDRDSILITEVPLKSGQSISTYIGLENNSSIRGSVSTRLLIVKSVAENNIRLYVWTNIGILYSGEELSFDNYRFPGSRFDFTGYELLSDIEGNILLAYNYRLGVKTAVELAVVEGSGEGLAYSIASIIETRSGGAEEINILPGVSVTALNIAQQKISMAMNMLRDQLGNNWYDDPGDVASSGGGGISEGGNGSETDFKAKTYTLTLTSQGDGNVSPAGVTEWLYVMAVNINASPTDYVPGPPVVPAVFGGWYENQKHISSNSTHTVVMYTNKCITGVFHGANTDCGRLSLKVRSHSTYINGDLRKRSLDVEQGNQITSSGSMEGPTKQYAGSIRFEFSDGVIYKARFHTHTGLGIALPSAADLARLYDIISGGHAISSGFIYGMIAQGEMMIIEITNNKLFVEYMKELGIDNYDDFKYHYEKNIIFTKNYKYDYNGVYNYLLGDNSGMTIYTAKSTKNNNVYTDNWSVVSKTPSGLTLNDCSNPQQ